jgi:ankyrin repeat protein
MMSEELLLAVRQQRDLVEIVYLLDEEEANINYQNEDGISALHEATLNLDINTMTLLLQRGATVDLVDNLGQTALNHLHAEYYDNDETDLLPAIHLLLHFNANKNHANHAGDTLLKWAVFNGYVQITACLLMAGARLTEDLFDEAQDGEDANTDEFDNPLDEGLASRYQQIIYLLGEAWNQSLLEQEDSMSSELDSSQRFNMN